MTEIAHGVKHLAVIMDGNGRWAKNQSLPRIDGHLQGAQVAMDIVESCVQKNIAELTLYALSVENLQRDPNEVKYITNLLTKTLLDKQRSLQENGIRVRVIGDLSRFDQKVRDVVRVIEEMTSENTVLQLNIAFNYSGRWQIQQALQHAAAQAAQPNSNQALFEHFEAHLRQDMKSDPDLLVRTGGEKRLSNFLLWHLAYTELYFSDVYWPDFSDQHLQQALETFASRERRFGKESAKPVIQSNKKAQCAGAAQ